ncbi:MAG: cytochrome c nitrite reductase small subunit [Sedimentisphaerales bacterium]|nr:cytochrome c nitrite reductase small subunit [Sedimentisphaerales bacterium]
MHFWDCIKAIITLRGLSRRSQIAIYMMVGGVLGLALITARLGNAASYLSNEPQTCMNCHVMTDAYATWQRGSHGKVAVCNDCHIPHSNIVAKTAFKARDGMKHSYVFTMRQEPQVLELSAGAKPVVRENCLRCHSDQFAMVRLADSSERNCWDCHDNIHGSVRSLSASPHVLRPQLPGAGLKFMQKGD